MTELRITLPHLESVKPPSDDEKPELNINDAGSILHADGEISPLTDPKLTIRYSIYEKHLLFFQRLCILKLKLVSRGMDFLATQFLVVRPM